VQTEKAFQRQQGVFLSSKKLLAKKTSTGVRFYKKIGLGKCARPTHPFSTSRFFSNRLLLQLLGFKTPQTAIEGTYVDKKCPFTGDVSIRGRIFK